MVLSRLSFKKNNAMLVGSFLILFAAVVNYYFFFDVLAPEIQFGSVKANMGGFFIVPVIVLASIQVVYAAGVLHLVIRSFYLERRDFLKAFFISSFLVFLFSVYYTLVPTWGPYSFLTGWYRGVTLATYGILALWTGVILFVTSMLIWRLYHFRYGEVRRTMVLLVAGAIFISVMAFATG